jgi:hypothetical protein
MQRFFAAFLIIIMSQISQRFDKTKENFGFWVKYSVLNPTLIYSVLAPGDSICDWSSAGLEKKQKVLEAAIARRNAEDDFYNKLETSVLENGLVNPLLVYAGNISQKYLPRLPLVMQQNTRSILACIHGASRLYYAKKYSLLTPCVIVDWLEVFPAARKIRSESEFRSLYKTPPEKFALNANGLFYTSLYHTHM